MKTDEKIKYIVNEYLKWRGWMEEEGFDKDDGELYKLWLNETAKEVDKL